MCFDGWSNILAFLAYSFLFSKFFIDKLDPEIQYIALIGVTVHLCVFVFLLMLDFIFKSDTLFFVGQLESTVGNITTTTTFGSIETNLSIQLDENENCFQQNPWALYRKHYIIVTLKLVCVILDFIILGMFNDGWKCATSKC